jgi:hypothetical protein
MAGMPFIQKCPDIRALLDAKDQIVLNKILSTQIVRFPCNRLHWCDLGIGAQIIEIFANKKNGNEVLRHTLSFLEVVVLCPI